MVKSSSLIWRESVCDRIVILRCWRAQIHQAAAAGSYVVTPFQRFFFHHHSCDLTIARTSTDLFYRLNINNDIDNKILIILQLRDIYRVYGEWSKPRNRLVWTKINVIMINVYFVFINMEWWWLYPFIHLLRSKWNSEKLKKKFIVFVDLLYVHYGLLIRCFI